MGYLAPTESEARAAGAAISRVTGTLGLKTSLPPAVSRALDSIAPGRGVVALRVQATGLANRIRTVIELDAAAAKQPEWQTGGRLQVAFEPEKGGTPTVVSATPSLSCASAVAGAVSSTRVSIATASFCSPFWPSFWASSIEESKSAGSIEVTPRSAAIDSSI